MSSLKSKIILGVVSLRLLPRGNFGFWLVVGSSAIVSVSCQFGVNLPGSDIIISVMMDGIGNSTAATGADSLRLLPLASVLQVLRLLLVSVEIVDRVRASDLSCLHTRRLLLLLPLLLSSVESE